MYTGTIIAVLVTSSLLSFYTADARDSNLIARQTDQCSDMDALNQNFGATYPQCASNLNALSQPFEITLRDLYCNTTCGPLYKTFFLSRCTSFSYRLVVDYYVQQCVVNEAGMPCYSFYNDSEIDMTYASDQAIQLCNATIRGVGACSDECRQRLTAVGNYYGTCINSVFNSTYFRSFNYELLPLFSYRLWTTCGAPIPTSTGDQPTGDTAQSPTSRALPSCSTTALLSLCGVVLATLWLKYF